MNRLKKEERRNQQEWEAYLKTLTPTAREQAIADKLYQDYVDEATVMLDHFLFYEQYDYIYDSAWDGALRKKGKNPMTEEYTEKVNRKRAHFGLQPLSSSGLPEDSSYDVCKQLVEAHFKAVNEPISDLVDRIKAQFNDFLR